MIENSSACKLLGVLMTMIAALLMLNYSQKGMYLNALNGHKTFK